MSQKQNEHLESYHYTNCLLASEDSTPDFTETVQSLDSDEENSDDEAEFREYLNTFYKTINDFKKENPSLSPKECREKLELSGVDTGEIKTNFTALFEDVPDSNSTKISMLISLSEIGILFFRMPEPKEPLETLKEDLQKEIDTIIEDN